LDADIVKALGRRSSCLSHDGCGKSSIGRRLAARLAFRLSMADTEIEAAAGMTIRKSSTITARLISAPARRGLSRDCSTAARRCWRPAAAPHERDTRAAIKANAISFWLRRSSSAAAPRQAAHRPADAQDRQPEETLRQLIAERYPVYALADATILSRDAPHEKIVEEIIDDLARLIGLGHGGGRRPCRDGSDPRRRNQRARRARRTRLRIAIGRGLLPGWARASRA